MASPETYRAAGVDYNAVLSGASIVLQRRADGRPYLRISSDRPVQEPFVDVILDLGWSAGRLVREYTLLVRPPFDALGGPTGCASDERATCGHGPVACLAAVAARARASTRGAGPVARTTPAAPRPAPAAQAADQGTVAVRSGDPCQALPAGTCPVACRWIRCWSGFTRQNPSAFQGDNMNRLRSGAVLTLPSSDQAKAVSPSEARQFIVARAR